MIGNKKFHNTEEGIIEMADYIISSFKGIDAYKIGDPKNISTIFLAGAPGSGKSEFMETIFLDLKKNFIVIDIDNYRNMFRGYDGENSSDYQQSSVRVADKVVSFCFKNNLNFILDGTFRSYGKVEQNIKQCEKYNRKMLITLIFQEPRISFYYTFLRKLNKKRNVPVDVFISGFYDSIMNIFHAMKIFDGINLMIVHKKYKDIDKNIFDYKIYSDIRDIYDFCRKFKIGYSKGIFTNRTRLKLDIESFQNTLIAQFCGKKNIFSFIRLWWFKNNL